MENKTPLGCVKQLFIATKQSRLSKTNIEVDENGIVEDKFYNKNIDRSILFSSTDAYDLMQKNNLSFELGALGENIIVDFNPYDLALGTHISLGDVVLEITTLCTLCNSLKKIDDTAPELLKNDRGVFAKVIKGGTITLNTPIYILN